MATEASVAVEVGLAAVALERRVLTTIVVSLSTRNG